MRLPEHIGIIPDGNRRWAINNGLRREKGYKSGLKPGLELYKLCIKEGIKEITYYGFTMDNTKRPRKQKEAFTKACIDAVNMLTREDAELRVIGNTESPVFPEELIKYTERQIFGNGGIKINFLVNYGWQWDLLSISNNKGINRNNLYEYLYSHDVSRVDLIIRWGGRRRLSGFLPVQSIYADFYVVDDYWPEFKAKHFYEALKWYDKQDITLGG